MAHGHSPNGARRCGSSEISVPEAEEEEEGYGIGLGWSKSRSSTRWPSPSVAKGLHASPRYWPGYVFRPNAATLCLSVSATQQSTRQRTERKPGWLGGRAGDGDGEASTLHGE